MTFEFREMSEEEGDEGWEKWGEQVTKSADVAKVVFVEFFFHILPSEENCAQQNSERLFVLKTRGDRWTMQ